jgi:hypothetical protein
MTPATAPTTHVPIEPTQVAVSLELAKWAMCLQY